MDSDGAGFRRPTLWSSASLTRLGSGATLGTSGFTMVSDGMGGNNYVNQVVQGSIGLPVSPAALLIFAHGYAAQDRRS